MNSNEKIASYLALNLKALRTQRNIGQQQLSSLSDIPRSTITYIESGSANPSLANLMKLSNALQVSIEELLKIPRSEIQKFTTKDLKTIPKGRSGSLVTYLIPEQLNGVELEKITLPKESFFKGVPHLSGTKEFCHCVKGKMSIIVDGTKYNFETGETLAFPGHLNHSYHNSNKKEASCISIVCLAK